MGSEDIRTRGDYVFEQLRERIIDGRLLPGERLLEREIAAELNVSRVPVRDALPRLAEAGLVTIAARRGAVISTVSITDAQELFDVRARLEPLAARRAAEAVAAGADATALRAALADEHGAEDSLHAGEAAARIHAEINALADHALLERMLRALEDRDRRLARVPTEVDPAPARGEHRRLVEAVLSGSAAAAEALALAHVELARGRSIAALEGRLGTPS
ncbi:GntR family transcriptional regulator [Mycetocola tolaasinivorans]|uniref:GntR family transcriptional regulator n=1 Tax=Mycetocola tolaasinivorans TaxID=76635 RepID=A0A3L7ABW7_9MICO|nr:GntR family transcriptional regulator [Mycetocola tolaasinivorans]RLP77300.1 GntR family transcriptional regulator [Mycetocola tolaasinivorans]